MCVIVCKPAGVKLERKYWEECFRSNGHGAGLTYVKDDKLVIDKGYFKFEALYKEIQENEELEMIVHFRISSAGCINKENCHPFRVKSKNFPHYSWAVSHNGTLPWRSTTTESDTNLFVREILGPQLDMHPWFLDNLPGLTLVTRFCGERNKLAILRWNEKTKESKIYIINKSQGVEDMGCWFSNFSYRLPIYTQRHWDMGDYDDYQVELESFLQKDFMNEKDWSKYGFHKNGQGKWVSNRLREVTQIRHIPQGQSIVQQNAMRQAAIEANRAIVVPRDVEVVEKEEKEKRFNQRLEHIHSKKGRKILRRMAHDYNKAVLDDETFKHMATHDMMMDFRDAVRVRTKNWANYTGKEDKEVDRMVVDDYLLREKMPDFMDEDLSEDGTPDAPDEIDEAIAADAKILHLDNEIQREEARRQQQMEQNS